MSGSRRNRTNLNTPVNPAKAKLLGHQVSQPQPGSTTIQYQYQQPQPVNVLNLGSEYRPMSIQRVQQSAPLVQGATTEMLNGVRSSPQVQSQTPRMPLPRMPLPTSSLTAQPRPNPPATDFVLDRLTAALKPILTAHQESIAARVDNMETFIEKLSSNMKETKDEAQGQTKQVVEAMQKAFTMQQAGNKALHERMAKLEMIIGTSDNGNDTKSLWNRLGVISFTVEELLERAKDPEAIVVDRPVPKAPIVPRQTYVDAGNDTQTPEPRTPPPQVILPILVQHATSPMRELHTDASNGPMTPVPKTPPPWRGSPVRLAYVDTANDPLDLEPPTPPPLPAVHSPVRPIYTDVSVDPRTPPISDPPRQYLSAGVATSPTADLHRISISSSRRYSEDAQTLVGDASCVESKSAVELDEASVSPKIKRKLIQVAYNLEDDDVDMVPLDDAHDGATVSNGEKIDKPSSAKSVKMRSHFDVSPMLSGSLSAADWSDGAHNDPHSDDENDHASSLPVFRPTSSPSVAKQYSLLKRRRDSLDGTVASLRQDALGDAHAVPAPSPSPQPIIPFHPRPSVSPLPSPESSPSPPPASARSRFKAKAIEVEATTPSPKRREPIIVSSPASVSSPMVEPRAATPTPVPISSPTPEEPRSSPVPGALLSSPARETPVPTPQEADPSQPSPSMQVNDAVLDSEDDSELSVRRMITETFENLQPVMQSAPLPLFLLGSESPPHSPPALPEYTSPSPTPQQAPIKNRVSVSSSRSPSPVANFNVKATKPGAASLNLISAQVAIKKPSSPTIKIPSPGKFMDFSGPKLSPTISPKLSLVVTSTRPKPRRISAVSTPRPKPQAVVTIPSSPFYIPSRTPSLLSDLSTSSTADHGNDSDSDVRIIPAKKKGNLKSKVNVKPEPRAFASASTSASGGPSSNANVNAKGGDTRPPAPPHVDLKKKLLNKSGKSAAVTRVKKRKALSLEEMEPPLKRAKQRLDAAEEMGAVVVKREKRSVAASSSKGDEKEKEKEKGGRVKGKEKNGISVPSSTGTSGKGAGAKLRPRAPPPPGCKWPEKNKTGDKKFNQQFVECDVCFLWYHYGCVGVSDSKDVRIKGGELFTCPPCSGGGANPMVPRNNNIVCGRPDCGQEEKRPDEYFMTGIVGRSTRVQSGTGRRYIWLVRWDGYSIKDCTWEEEDGMTDPHSFIQHFNDSALREGIDPEADPHSTILLREAIAGGWKDPNA